MSTEMTTNILSRVEGRPLLEAVTGAMTYVSPEAQWLWERLSGGEGLISGWG